MESPEGCGRLEVYRLANDLAMRIHAMTMNLPPFERFEEGPQIRRSSKRVVANLVEGYAQRRYRDEFLHYLYRSLGSADETRQHLLFLVESGSLKDKVLADSLSDLARRVSEMMMRFIQGVEAHHGVPRFVRGPRDSRPK